VTNSDTAYEFIRSCTFIFPEPSLLTKRVIMCFGFVINYVNFTADFHYMDEYSDVLACDKYVKE